MHTIYTIGGGEFMRDFFNGVATLVNSNIYATAFKVMIVIGVIWYGFRASNGALKEAIKWILTVVLIVYIMLFAKTSVVIADKANVGLSGNKIDNVPFGLAVIAGISSSFGEHLTSGFEQMFSLPNDLQYSQNGLILGSKIIRETSFAEFAMNGGIEEQQRFKSNFQEFIEACVITNAQQGIPYNTSQLKTSTNLWSLISNKSGLSPIFTFKYTHANNTQEFLSCKDGIDNITNDFNNQISQTETSIASRLFPNYNDALNKYQTNHKTALDYLTTASKTASDNLIQAIMVNEIQQSVSNYASSLGSHTITPYEQARIDIQQRNNYRIIGAKANTWLVLTKTLFEAMLYALFPLVVLYMVAPFGGIDILKNYIMAFAWLTLWGPSYAVINMIANYSNKIQTGEVFGSGLTIANQMQVIGVQEQISSMAGYFTMLVPFLSLIVLKGLGAMTSLSHKLGSVMEGTTSQVAGESSTGNISAGNTSFNNTSANKYDASHFFKGQGHSTRVNDDGLSVSQTASGISTVDDSGITSKLNTSFNVNKQEMSSLSNSISQIESQSTNKAISSAISNGFSANSTDGYSTSHMDSISDSMNYTKNISEDLSKSTGLTQQQVLEASAGIKGGMGFAEFGARYGGSTTSSDAYNQVAKLGNSEQFSEAFSYMQQNSMNASISYTDSHGNTQTSTIDEALRTSQDYSKQLSNMEQLSIMQSTGMNDEYKDFVQSRHNPETAEAVLNHKVHGNGVDELRAKDISDFQKSISGNNTENYMASKQHMQEMEARAFINKHDNVMNSTTHGYSNADTKDRVEQMMGYTSDNIQNEKHRFTNTIEADGSKIENKASDHVFHGSYDAIKDNVKGLFKKEDEE